MISEFQKLRHVDFPVYCGTSRFRNQTPALPPPPALTRGGAAPAAPRDLRPQVLEQLCALRPEHIPVVPNVVPRLEGAPPTAVCGGVRHSSALQAAPHGGAHSRGTVRWKALTDQIYILEFSENENGNMRHF